MKRIPPGFATWLLTRLGRGYQSDSLLGDLLEEYQRGRGRLWYWRQVLSAIRIARLSWSMKTRLKIGRWAAQGAAEIATMLFLVGLVDESHKSSAAEMFERPMLLLNLSILLVIAVAATIAAVHFRRQGKRLPA